MRSIIGNTSVAFASFLASTGVIAFADPAHASLPERGTPAVTVSTADLNLASDAGRDTAERRIRTAAGQVCQFDGNPLSAAGRCRSDAIQQARQTLADLAAR